MSDCGKPVGQQRDENDTQTVSESTPTVSMSSRMVGWRDTNRTHVVIRGAMTVLSIVAINIE